MIKNGLVPNLEQSVAIDYGFEPVRTECAEDDREKAKCCGNSSKCDHILLLTELVDSGERLNPIFQFLHARRKAASAAFSRYQAGVWELGKRGIQTVYGWLILRL